jgi:hypothetical protein
MIRASGDQPMIPDGYEISPVSDRKNKWKQFSLLSPIFSETGKNHFPPPARTAQLAQKIEIPLGPC